VLESSDKAIPALNTKSPKSSHTLNKKNASNTQTLTKYRFHPLFSQSHYLVAPFLKVFSPTWLSSNSYWIY